MSRDRAGALAEVDRRRIRATTREIENLWPERGLLTRVAELLPGAFEGENAAIAYLRSDDGGLDSVGHTFAPPFDRWESIRGSATLPRHLRYSVSSRESIAGRPISERQLFRGDAERLEHYRADILEPNGLWFQLRATLYEDEDEFGGFVGVLRPKDGRAFGAREAQVMGELLPTVHEWIRVARWLREATGDVAVLAVIDALDEPAFLTTAKGTLIHANPPARRRYPSPPEWLRGVARSGAGSSRLAKVAPIRVTGEQLLLVRPTNEGGAAAPGALPKYLRPTAELMARGLSDKEIASALELSHATVRTFTQRVLQQLGLSSRRELMLAWSRLRPE